MAGVKTRTIFEVAYGPKWAFFCYVRAESRDQLRSYLCSIGWPEHSTIVECDVKRVRDLPAFMEKIKEIQAEFPAKKRKNAA